MRSSFADAAASVDQFPATHDYDRSQVFMQQLLDAADNARRDCAWRRVAVPDDPAIPPLIRQVAVTNDSTRGLGFYSLDEQVTRSTPPDIG